MRCPHESPFVTKDQLEAIAAQYPTPFHLYDERGIRENARRLRPRSPGIPATGVVFAVKATPTPAILKLLKEEGCGCDCSSLAELIMAERCGITGEDIMFSSNETPPEEFQLADKLGAIMNLDDFTLIEDLERATGKIPEKVCCRYNPGGVFALGETREGFSGHGQPWRCQIRHDPRPDFRGVPCVGRKGAREFGLHSFLASNTLSNEYYPVLARMLFQLAVELKEETGCRVTFINLSGGVGVPYHPDQPENDIAVIGEGVRKAYEEILVPAGLGDVALYTELGRFMLAPMDTL